jgi:NADPH:quinone reductase-like Zn-dependent oxidoreductase/acyl carrier protein
LIAGIEVANTTGRPVLRIDGLSSRRRPRAGSAAPITAPSFYREETVELPVTPGHPSTGDWLLLTATGCTRARTVAHTLCETGRTVEVRDIDACTTASAPPLAALIDDARRTRPGLGLLYAVPLAAAVSDADRTEDAAMRETMRIVRLGRALAALDPDELPSLTVLTRNARALPAGGGLDDAGLVQAPVLAAARTIAMELPTLRLRLVDLDDGALADAASLHRALEVDPAETEIVIRGGRAYGVRLNALQPADAPRASRPARTLPAGVVHVLRHAGPPGSEGLHWQAVASPALPAAGEVLIAPRAVGLNFRDVMAVSGLLPAAAEAGPALDALGLEFSGVVEAVGNGVDDLAVGDHVLAMGRGALRSRLCLPRIGVHRVPAGLSYAAAASIPSAFLTAHYALNEIGRLRRGETVLIHSATGGVGLAAIALARRAGANIVATAGTPEKRAHLLAMGIAHVLDSRSLAFADGVMQATGGRGVDVVLNALGGAFIGKGIACLAPYGRFMELGKRDVYEDAAIGLRALRTNASFHVVDLAALIVERPEHAARLMQEVLAMVSADEIGPLPCELYRASEATAAFRRLASARHIGKVVIDMDDPEVAVNGCYATGVALDPSGSYLVTGGTRGFGLAVGRWLAVRGAGRVVLASRSGERPVDTPPGIEAVRLDVGNRIEVESLIGELALSGRPLRGIVHAAVVYDDALLAALGEEQVRRVLAPKIAGALNIARAVERTSSPLDFLVMFSSMAQTVGWPGQANYAAANSFLAAFATRLRADGIPAQCIEWGALGESGHVARRSEMQSYLESSGWTGMSDTAALVALAEAMDLDLPALTIAAVDWQRLAATHPAIARSARLAGLRAGDAGGPASGRPLATLDGDALDVAALALVRAQTARVLRTRTADLAPDIPLAEAGIDSLSSFELHNRIEQEAGFAVPMPRFTKARRIGELARLLAALVREARTDTEHA